MTTPLGKYKLVKLIAAGGMAEVFLARQSGAAGFEKQVCLKRILPHLARDKAFVEMFLNEARLASQLDHPNIVSIYDLGEANGNYFIAMEFIDGPNLRTVARRAQELGELLPIPEVVRIIAQAAAGLQYAHDLTDADGRPLGLVHRDISPDNILVHRNGTAKVVDFGIAKAANSSGMTRTGTLKGKIAYMPPEQLRAEPLDRRTDLFALGVVTYELIGGRRPWEAESEVALITQIMVVDPPPLTELRQDCPPELWAIVHRALARDREERYQDCNELIADLEALLVQMGQSITSTRVADFVRAYAPPKIEAGSDGTEAQLGAIEAHMSAVEAETFGTGSAAPLLGGRVAQVSAQPRIDPAPTGSGPDLLPLPEGGGTRAGMLYGLLAFGAILLLGGAGALVWMLRGGGEEPRVAIERARPRTPVAPQPPAGQEPAGASIQPTSTAVAIGPGADSGTDGGSVSPGRPEGPQRPRHPTRSDPQTPQPEPERPPAPEPPRAPAAKGELVLQARPWAKITIDGRAVGETPVSVPVAAGPHQIGFSNAELGKSVTRAVEVGPGERKVVRELLDE
jgi:serine/threonine-protein kinase